MVSAVVTSPSSVSALLDVGFRAGAANVVHPDLSTTTTVHIAKEPSAAVYSHKSFGLTYTVRLHDTVLQGRIMVPPDPEA